ncbi:hypothetical protein ACF3MZ_19780 [Paenibacillaceae bacterium WGS1546]|uniref:hypothetical protein n=1 Tax=Cohnella sp. WGS1546 TaxID=3366810 RepID=UPI00372D47AF
MLKKPQASKNKRVLKKPTDILEGKYSDSELVIGLVGAVGTEQNYIVEIIKDRLQTAFRYKVESVHVSKDVISSLYPPNHHESDFDRVQELIEFGNRAREKSGDNSILALGVASEIFRRREIDQETVKPKIRTAYIINSLKHPAEVEIMFLPVVQRYIARLFRVIIVRSTLLLLGLPK